MLNIKILGTQGEGAILAQIINEALTQRGYIVVHEGDFVPEPGQRASKLNTFVHIKTKNMYENPRQDHAPLKLPPEVVELNEKAELAYELAVLTLGERALASKLNTAARDFTKAYSIESLKQQIKQRKAVKEISNRDRDEIYYQALLRSEELGGVGPTEEDHKKHDETPIKRVPSGARFVLTKRDLLSGSGEKSDDQMTLEDFRPISNIERFDRVEYYDRKGETRVLLEQ